MKDRVNAYNALISNAQGERKWKINTHACPVTTESLEKQVWGEDGMPDKKAGHDHANDANGYFLVKRWPIVRPVAAEVRRARALQVGFVGR